MMGDIQSSDEEDGGKGELFAEGEIETPDGLDGEDEDAEVEEDVGDGGTKERGVAVDALAVRVGAYPGGFDGDAFEDVDKDGSDAPAEDEGDGNIYDFFEGFAYAKNTIVEEEDGDFDKRDADGVEDLVGDGCFEEEDDVAFAHSLEMAADAVLGI